MLFLHIMMAGSDRYPLWLVLFDLLLSRFVSFEFFRFSVVSGFYSYTHPVQHSQYMIYFTLLGR